MANNGFANHVVSGDKDEVIHFKQRALVDFEMNEENHVMNVREVLLAIQKWLWICVVAAIGYVIENIIWNVLVVTASLPVYNIDCKSVGIATCKPVTFENLNKLINGCLDYNCWSSYRFWLPFLVC